MGTVSLGLSGIQKWNSTGEGAPLVVARCSRLLGGNIATDGFIGGVVDYDEYGLFIKSSAGVIAVRVPFSGYYELDFQTTGTQQSADAIYNINVLVRNGSQSSDPSVVACYSPYYATTGRPRSFPIRCRLYLKVGTSVWVSITQTAGSGFVTLLSDASTYLEIKALSQDTESRSTGTDIY